MGAGLDKDLNEKLSEDIININQITCSDKFYKKMGINFQFNSNPDNNNIFNQKIINVKIENEENKPKSAFKINPLEFYNFYNTLLECSPIFYENSIYKTNLNKQNKEEEEELCCICEDRKSDHFFCESCIQAWLCKKTNSCPLCRVIITLSTSENKSSDNNFWNVIETNEIDHNEYFGLMRDRLKDAIIVFIKLKN